MMDPYVLKRGPDGRFIRVKQDDKRDRDINEKRLKEARYRAAETAAENHEKKR